MGNDHQQLQSELFQGGTRHDTTHHRDFVDPHALMWPFIPHQTSTTYLKCNVYLFWQITLSKHSKPLQTKKTGDFFDDDFGNRHIASPGSPNSLEESTESITSFLELLMLQRASV